MAAHNQDLEALQKENVALKKENVTLKIRAKGLEHQVSLLEGELVRANSKVIVERFLASRAFANIAPLAYEDLLKYLVYRKLLKLGKIYLFTPQQVSFLDISEEKRRAKSLQGYSWDEKANMIVDPKGELMQGMRTLTLQSAEPTRILYPWPAKNWPENVTVPRPKKVPRTVPSTPCAGNTSASPHSSPSHPDPVVSKPTWGS